MIEIKALTFNEQNAYDDFVEELKGKNYTEDKVLRESIKYICENIYKMDLNDAKHTMMTCLYVFGKTMEASQKLEEDELKNYVKFGTGELKAE